MLKSYLRTLLDSFIKAQSSWICEQVTPRQKQSIDGTGTGNYEAFTSPVTGWTTLQVPTGLGNRIRIVGKINNDIIASSAYCAGQGVNSINIRVFKGMQIEIWVTESLAYSLWFAPDLGA